MRQKDLSLCFIADSIFLLEAEGKHLPALCLLRINCPAWATPRTRRDNHASRHAHPWGRETYPEIPLEKHYPNHVQKKAQDVILCTTQGGFCGQMNLGTVVNHILLEIHKAC